MPNAAIVQPVVELRFLDADVSVERRPDGAMVLRTEVRSIPTATLTSSGFARSHQMAFAVPRSLLPKQLICANLLPNTKDAPVNGS